MRYPSRVHFLTAALIVAAVLSIGAQEQPQGLSVEPRLRPEPDYGLDVSIWAGRSTYEIGDSAKLYVRANRAAYIFVYSTSPRGRTRQIFPNYYDRNNLVEGGKTYRLPQGRYVLRVTPPTGREVITIHAFSADRGPMWSGRRYSSDEPFPNALSPEAELSRMSVQRRHGRDYATDTTTIRVVSEREHPNADRDR